MLVMNPQPSGQARVIPRTFRLRANNFFLNNKTIKRLFYIDVIEWS